MPSREKNLHAFVGLIGEAMDSLSKQHEARGITWPSHDFVQHVKKETAEGRIPILIKEGDTLARHGSSTTMGQHGTVRRGGVKIKEFIEEPSNLFNPDGTINERMGAVLVHEYCHALQDAAMENMPATQRAMVPIASIEHANQALAISVWEEMKNILSSSDQKYEDIRGKLRDSYEGFDGLPAIDIETMRYQDRVSKYPGAIFMAQHPEFFEEKEIEADTKEEHLMDLARDVAKQIKAVEEEHPKMPIDIGIRENLHKRFVGNQINGIDQYMEGMRKETNGILDPFEPAAGEEVENVVGFYAREIKHLRELSKLEGMKGNIENLSGRQLNALRDFALKNELTADVKAVSGKDLIDFAMAHKVGELEANREGIERASNILGARLQELHKLGRDPEEKLMRFADPTLRDKLGRIKEEAKEKEKGKFREAGRGIMDRMRRPI